MVSILAKKMWAFESILLKTIEFVSAVFDLGTILCCVSILKPSAEGTHVYSIGVVDQPIFIVPAVFFYICSKYFVFDIFFKCSK